MHALHKHRVYSSRSSGKICKELPPSAPPLIVHEGRSSNFAAATCDDDAETLKSKGVSLLVGILSAPGNFINRQAIRQTWMQWESAGRSTLICFVIGRLSVGAKVLDSVDSESRQHHDILWLPQTSDGCYLTVSKVFDWWRAASSRLSIGGVRHVVKVDEDSFLHVPNLELLVARLSCVERLYFGGGAWAGYDPMKYKMCGFSFRGDSAYARYGCGKRGVHPPMPFVMGGVQGLSAELVTHLASSRAIAEFVVRSDGAIDYGKLAASNGVDTINDDVMLGFWLHDAQVRRGLANVTYAFINERATNLECDMRDCAAQRICSFYKLPSNASLLIHNLKSAAQMLYVWAVIRGQFLHDASTCKRFGHKTTALSTAQRWMSSLRNPAGDDWKLFEHGTSATREPRKRGLRHSQTQK